MRISDWSSDVCSSDLGCLRQLVLIAWPGWIAEMSISVDDSASTSADGFIWLTSGSTTVAAPTPAKLTAAILMKSRRRTPSSMSALRLVSLAIRLHLQIGRAHVCTPVTNAHLVCRRLLDKTNE